MAENYKTIEFDDFNDVLKYLLTPLEKPKDGRSPYSWFELFNNWRFALKGRDVGENAYMQLDRNGKGPFIFRGEKQDYGHLTPSIFRESSYQLIADALATENGSSAGSEYDPLGPIVYEQFLAEYQILWHFSDECNRNGLYCGNRDFFKEYPSEIFVKQYIHKKGGNDWLPESLEEIAVLAQHYGVPTRLLDWSYDLLTAIYFAANGAVQDMRNARFRSLNPSEDCQKDSRIDIRSNKMVIWALNADVIRANTSNIVLAEPPYSNNPNLNAQKGALTYYRMPAGKIKDQEILQSPREPDNGLWKRIFPDAEFENYIPKRNDELHNLYKILIPWTAAKELLLFANIYGHDSGRMFPGYQGSALDTKELGRFARE